MRASVAKPILVLTHTNAGVAALRGRLEGANVNPRSYRLSTIDGWAMRLVSTFPARSGAAPNCLTLANPKTDYPNIRNAAFGLLKSGHIRDVIHASYSRLLVDEYQDCSLHQHGIVYCTAATLPSCLLGDPMQGIFGFQGRLVDWATDVCAHFPLVGELTTPWRWKNAGTESFGQWLLNVRKKLLAREAIDLRTAPSNVTWVHLDGTENRKRQLKAAATRAPDEGGSVLIIGDAINPAGQREFASQTPGAVTVESVDLRDLVTFAEKFDLSQPDAVNHVIDFAQSVMTNVGAAEMIRRVDSLRRGTARKAASEAEQAALDFTTSPSHTSAGALLAEIGRQGGVRAHRPGVLQACLRTLRSCKEGEPNALYEAAIRVREQNRALGRSLPRRAVGSTLLLKGLEAEVAVILNADALDAHNLYVAMTRSSKALVVCSSNPILQPR